MLFEQVFAGCVEERVKEEVKGDQEEERLRGPGIEFT